jgi:hypothetical protein
MRSLGNCVESLWSHNLRAGLGPSLGLGHRGNNFRQTTASNRGYLLKASNDIRNIMSGPPAREGPRQIALRHSRIRRAQEVVQRFGFHTQPIDSTYSRPHLLGFPQPIYSVCQSNQTAINLLCNLSNAVHVRIDIALLRVPF